MKLAVYCAGATVVLILGLMWLMTQIHYRIGSKHLKVMLFGLALRKLPLENIIDVSKREPKGMAEYWPNCFKRNHRVLTLEMKQGLRKFILITPRHRYVFLGDLKAAVRRIDPASEFAKRGVEETTTTLRRSEIEKEQEPQSS